YTYESITRIGFGGRYEAALALAAGADPRCDAERGPRALASAAHPAAVDRDDLARHVRARGRGEVDERRGEVVGRAPAACRDAVEHLLVADGIVAQALVEVGRDVAGGDGVHADAVRCPLVRERAR